MSRAKEVGTAVGTLACALVIGFAMQSTQSATRHYNTSVNQTTEVIREVVRFEERETTAPIAVRDITLTSALPTRGITLPQPQNRLDAYTPSSDSRSYFPPTFLKVADTDACAVNSHAQTQSAAVVHVTLEAECRPNEVVTIAHSGMVFSAMTDASGYLSVSVPALAEAAVFVLSFSDGDSSVAFSTVPNLDDYKRVVLQWRGPVGFELHAREFGADYGTEGHIWRGAETSTDHTVVREGGVLTTLGQQTTPKPMMAEVYSIPSRFPQREGQVDLSIEALISHNNCGSEVEAQTLEFDGTKKLRRRHLSLAMPDCDTVGDYLVLNNVLDSLTVTAN